MKEKGRNAQWQEPFLYSSNLDKVERENVKLCVMCDGRHQTPASWMSVMERMKLRATVWPEQEVKRKPYQEGT